MKQRRFPLQPSLFPALTALAALLLGWASPCRAGEEKSAPAAKTAPFEIQAIKDLPYYEGKDADPVKHRLDLFLPRNHKDFPVLFFVHGGAWVHGDKSGLLGIYKSFGAYWAKHGVGVVVINYRLAPKVTYPEQIKDVARAFAWTHKNIGKYGGLADRIFVCGHSAGGHLVSLLATNDAYLKAEGLSLKDIRGVIPISGVYKIPENDRLFDLAFGTDPKQRRDASPLCHARPDAPPFLIIYADTDLKHCGKDPSEEFCKCLKDKKCEAQTLEVTERNHVSVLLSANVEGDPVSRAIQEFVAAHSDK